jgi:hypothetical protein
MHKPPLLQPGAERVASGKCQVAIATEYRGTGKRKERKEPQKDAKAKQTPSRSTSIVPVYVFNFTYVHSRRF